MPSSGSPASLRVGGRVGDDPLAVVRLVAGEPQHLFGIVDLVARRDDVVVGDDVVVIGAAHRAGIAQPVDDDRRRPQREELRAAHPSYSR